MKKFAFYLPQFHEVEENNIWWGKGFTEWTNVRKATRLYKGHIQPIEPLGDNYYDLLDKETFEWQTKIAEQYGIDGFIFYHYYFTGKRILEKPVENFLKWKDINQKYFFCWANHSWNRSWNGTKEVLIEQTYGKREDWEEHFNYLFDFFKDDRYEKKDNKPVFMIYDTNFSEAREMFEYFEELCKKNGFDGLCLIESVNNPNKSYNKKFDQTEYVFLREPNIATKTFHYDKRNVLNRFINKSKKIIYNKWNVKGVVRYNGNRLYDVMNKYKWNKGFIYGAFFSWDNTPRHSFRGYVISEPKKEKFFKYMNRIKKSEYVFFNAWNEWAEGMVLEPTKHNGFKYLEWIKEWTDDNVNSEL